MTIEEIRDRANQLVHENHPMLEKPIETWHVVYILKALLEHLGEKDETIRN